MKDEKDCLECAKRRANGDGKPFCERCEIIEEADREIAGLRLASRVPEMAFTATLLLLLRWKNALIASEKYKRTAMLAMIALKETLGEDSDAYKQIVESFQDAETTAARTPGIDAVAEKEDG